MSIIESTSELSLTAGFTQSTDSVAKATKAAELDEVIGNSTVNKLASDIQQDVTSVNGQAEEANQTPLTVAQLQKVAQQLQDFVGEMNRGIEFSVDTDSGRDVIKVIDKSTGDILKQYPSEEVLSLVAKLSDMVGGFVDAKV